MSDLVGKPEDRGGGVNDTAYKWKKGTLFTHQDEAAMIDLPHLLEQF